MRLMAALAKAVHDSTREVTSIQFHNDERHALGKPNNDKVLYSMDGTTPNTKAFTLRPGKHDRGKNNSTAMIESTILGIN